MCEHYQRKCLVYAECCQTFFDCHHCHNKSNSDHELDKKTIKLIKCKLCEQIQKPQQECEGCHEIFSEYFCEICNIFDCLDKKIKHCDGCTICRVYDKEYFHCYNCNCCLDVNLKDNHKCLNVGDCPICYEDLFSSIKSWTLIRCGHHIHTECLKELLKQDYHKCPACQKTLFNDDVTKEINEIYDKIIEQNIMPDEYINVMKDIYCNDCNLKSNAKFHFMAMKCASCGSYNTCTV